MMIDVLIQKLKDIVGVYHFDEKPNSEESPNQYFYLSGLETVCDDIKEIIRQYEEEESK